jgi:hypothetical protein
VACFGSKLHIRLATFSGRGGPGYDADNAIQGLSIDRAVVVWAIVVCPHRRRLPRLADDIQDLA